MHAKGAITLFYRLVLYYATLLRNTLLGLHHVLLTLLKFFTYLI